LWKTLENIRTIVLRNVDNENQPNKSGIVCAGQLCVALTSRFRTQSAITYSATWQRDTNVRMRESDRDIIQHLRKLDSPGAANWLIKHHPQSICRLIPHRSWEKPEQETLAKHYLANIPHASALRYRSLLSVMTTYKIT